MSTTRSRTRSPAVDNAPLAFPILMRLPDLRQAAAPLAAATPVMETSNHRASELPAEPTKSVHDLLAEPAADHHTTASPRTQVTAETPAVSPAAPATAHPVVLAPSQSRKVEIETLESDPNPVIKPPNSLPIEQPTITADNIQKSPPSADSVAVEPSAAAPAAETKPVSPAAARIQRAQQRQQRTQAESNPGSWWKSHAPKIAAGFLLALVLTIFVARKGNHSPTQAAADPEIPQLDIDMGSVAGRGDAGLGARGQEPGVSKHDLKHEQSSEKKVAEPKPEEKKPEESKTRSKLPPLLGERPSPTKFTAADSTPGATHRPAATDDFQSDLETTPPDAGIKVATKPQIDNARPASEQHSLSEQHTGSDQHTVAKPAEQKTDAMDSEFPGLNAPGDARTTSESPRPGERNDFSNNLPSSYPSTEPAFYRPGGRAPRTARAPQPTPNNPNTAPNWR